MSNIYNPITATAGAIPYINEKGERSMKPVKVNRYVAGKAPDYYHEEEFEMIDEQDEDKLRIIFPDRPLVNKKIDNETETVEEEDNEDDIEDSRLARLRKLKELTAPQFLDESDSDAEDTYASHIRERQLKQQLDTHIDGDKSDADNDEDNEEDEEERAMKRQLMREKALAFNNDAEFPNILADLGEEDDYVEYSDDEESDSDNEKEPKLKPVFVQSNHRRTINKTQEEVVKEQKKEEVRLRRLEEDKRRRRKMIEDYKKEDAAAKDANMNNVDTDDDVDNDGEYEAWKIREWKRIKRDADEREAWNKQREELVRIRSMTDEQRLEEFKRNPKVISNQAPKGQMKFMQRYYHRGAYYVHDLEDKVFQRDFTAPTLEDNFNILNRPGVLQVKNFGRAGRTKYTHLVDQDTTDFDAGWSKEGQSRFFNNRGGGMKQQFDKPNHRKNK